MKTFASVVSALRVRQWIKNLLVFAAPAGAGVLFETEALIATVLAFVSFSLAASALYLTNDVADIESDRRHPKKRGRPIASGEISVPVAVTVAVGLAAGSLLIAWIALPREFLWVLGAYATNTLLYIGWGKHVPIVDIMQVALGFVLRAVAGAAATGVLLSQWFLAAAMFGSLLMVSGKRSSELAHVGESEETRPVLTAYRGEYLRQTMVISAGALLLTYALWALGDTEAPIRSPWALISFAPFVYSVFRYIYLSDSGDAEEPERLVVVDRGMQVGALAWLACIVVGIYL
jgi:decaprenyl-phosphate phosphoribosyltransferase